MLRNKLNLFLLNLIIYSLYSVAANESSEEEYNSEGSEDSDLLKVLNYAYIFLNFCVLYKQSRAFLPYRNRRVNVYGAKFKCTD